MARTNSRRERRALHAMTLVEVLAVVVILSLIAATVLVGFGGMFGRAKTELARTGAAMVASKVEAYRIERSAYPTAEVGLTALTAPAATPSNSYYVSADRLLDPWGRTYLYVVPGPDGEPFEVVSLGADGKAGGQGEDSDISSVRARATEGGSR
jgi:general secretion pathway protein G